jgi:hypothetical protein
MMSSLANTKCYPVITLSQNCDHVEFYNVATNIENLLGITFFNKTNDFDSLFWDFQYRDTVLTLHFNVFLGLSIYPAKCMDCGLDDQKIMEEIYQILSKAST